ncbi:MAG: ATP-binding protein [Halocynthiibacter sp.]
MMTANFIIIVSVVYVALLFAVAAYVERRAQKGHFTWLRSPLIYTLSLSVYCTAWTFYGAVGFAARAGLEFLTIYLGPTLVLIGWWWVLRRLVRIGRDQKITSIADLISSRFGKSNWLGVIVTLMAVIGTTPYIALQLQSVTVSFAVFAGDTGGDLNLNSIAFYVAMGLALFTVLFGTRNLDANERHHGVVTAIALEAVVKLFALIAVGVFVVWGIADGFGDIIARIDASPIANWSITPSRWIGLTFLAGAAFLTLPRMFQVLVVENADESHLQTASWAFPLYLMLMSLFVLPIAVIGLEIMPEGANPDFFVLSIPQSQGQSGLAVLAFLGGFSSATSMVIVAAIALSTMVSNHIVMPIWLSFRQGGAQVSGDMRAAVLYARRVVIIGVLGLGYLYYNLSGGGAALASIGLISFTGVVQVMPALLGALFWRRATKLGAGFGLVVGFVVWAFTLFLPSFEGSFLMGPGVIEHGIFGLSWLRPNALFGVSGFDPLIHALIWSLTLNAAAFCLGSFLSSTTPIEQLQSTRFVEVFSQSESGQTWRGQAAEAEDLLIMAQRIMGAKEAQALFEREARAQGKRGYLPDTTSRFLNLLERELSGSVGAATAHTMVGQIAGGDSVTVEDVIAMADESAQLVEYSTELEAKSKALRDTAQRLKDANDMLTQISHQKDAFLSQISHELRTPMTSIRAFSEILRSDAGGDAAIPDADRKRFSEIINLEAERLTRLLDDLLDLSVLESGQVRLNRQKVRLGDVIERALIATVSDQKAARLDIQRMEQKEDVMILTDADRLLQVFVNLISNTAKYCPAALPELRVAVRAQEDSLHIDFIDNGPGLPPEKRDVIFEKFSRLSDQAAAGSAGLGLAICREILNALGGEIAYLPGQSGTAFRVTLPRHMPPA